MPALSCKNGVNTRINVRIIQSLLISLAILFSCSISFAQTIFTDDFSSGNMSKTQNGFKWLGSTSAQVVSFSGSNALEFTYNASGAGQDGMSEQRFDLGAYYPNVWIQYDMYVPSNYNLREPSTNDKSYLYLWTDNYSGVGGVGGGFQNWTNANGQGDYLTFYDWSGPSDKFHATDSTRNPKAFGGHKGKWVNIIIHMKAGSGSSDGSAKLWVDGVLTYELNSNNSPPGYNISSFLYNANGNNAFRNGYLLGWSNNGFSQTTKIYIDNFKFSTSQLINSDPPSSPIGQ